MLSLLYRVVPLAATPVSTSTECMLWVIKCFQSPGKFSDSGTAFKESKQVLCSLINLNRYFLNIFVNVFWFMIYTTPHNVRILKSKL
jgi:hypothetical protein